MGLFSAYIGLTAPPGPGEKILRTAHPRCIRTQLTHWPFLFLETENLRASDGEIIETKLENMSGNEKLPATTAEAQGSYSYRPTIG